MDIYDSNIDFEAPERMDIELLRSHIAMLDAGAEICVPSYDFTTGIQSMNGGTVQLGGGSVAIFEGIHALSDLFCSVGDPTGIYISARMRVTRGGEVFMPPEWLRFVRRSVRDAQFRGSDFARTLELWKNVRRGETRYILPSKGNAHITIDTSLAYEPCLFAPLAVSGLRVLPRETLRERGLDGIAERLARFTAIERGVVPGDSLMKEFIGR
jgi:uridine kinase